MIDIIGEISPAVRSNINTTNPRLKLTLHRVSVLLHINEFRTVMLFFPIYFCTFGPIQADCICRLT